MKFQVYEYGGGLHDNINNEIIDGSAFCFNGVRFLKILNGRLGLMFG